MTGPSPVTVTNLPAGTYDVNVTDLNGCTSIGSVTISDEGGPIIDNIVATDEVCGNANGTAEVFISGGLAPFTLTIDSQTETGASPITIIGLVAGTYPVDILDANGCMTSGTVTIGEIQGPTISSVDIENEICDLGNGSLTINVNGGVSPITYDIGVGPTQVDNNSFIDLSEGTYNITVTDNNGCSVETVATIDNTPGVIIDLIDNTDASCDQDNGQTTITISGGVGPFSYDLSGTVQVNNGTFLNLVEDTYDLVVTDNNGCTATATIVIGGSEDISILSIDTTVENCGNQDGSATINISGGTAPITYIVDGNSQIDNNIFLGLAAGTYDVSVSDANGCSSTSTVTIDEIEGPTIDDIVVVDASCGQSDGEATILASGGAQPYTYNVDGVIQVDPNNLFTGLASGSYILIVTDNNGCSTTGTVNISDSNGPIFDNIDITDANCDSPSGSVTITVSGGTAPLTIFLDGVTNGTGTFNNLLPGDYTASIEDANGCVSTQLITIANIPGVEITNIETTNETCGNSDGTKTVFFIGGQGSYTVTCNGNTFSTPNNFFTFTDLPAGIYNVEIVDSNGCFDSGSATVDESEAPQINNIVPTNANCGMDNGSLTINASGGVDPLTYDIGSGPQASNIFTDLFAGTYTIIVSDANNCTAESTATITDLPGVQIDNILTTDATCGNSDGTKTINVSGGSPPYTYDCNGLIQVGNNFYSNLAAGTYNVLVTDAAGCTDMQIATISDSDGPEIINIDIVDATCGLANAVVTITANGGTAPYTYYVNGVDQTDNQFTDLLSGDITVLVEDANGCSVSINDLIEDTPGIIIDEIQVTNSSCGQNDGAVTILVSNGAAPFTYVLDGDSQTGNNTFTDLFAGTYPLVITDDVGCSITSSVTILENGGVTIDNLVIVEEDCGMANGSVTVNISGGEAPFSYQLDLGTGQISNLFDGLSEGTYDILVTDVNGCTATDIAIVPGAQSPTIDNIIIENASCNNQDGSLTIEASNGTPAYMYDIGNGNQASNIFDNLASGTYTVTVTDANGCTDEQEAIIIDTDGPTITSIVVVDASSAGNDGTITVTASGGTPPYTFNVNGVDMVGDPTVTFDNLPGGTYVVTVTDANGCTATDTATILNDDCVVIDGIVSTNSICDDDNGTITVTASGGVDPILYALDAGVQQASNVFMNVGEGNYVVTVTDAAGCSATQSVEVVENGSPVIDNIDIVDATCEENNGEIQIFASEGLQPYNYSIDGVIFQTSSVFDNLQANNYQVTVEDANGCQTTMDIIVESTPIIVVDDIVIINTTCGDAVGSATFIVSDGVPDILYSINGGTFQASNIFLNLAAGAYTYIIVDNNCTISGVFAVTNEGAPEITDIAITNASCNEDNGAVTISIDPGTNPHTYTIGATVQVDNPTFTDLTPGDYVIVVEDANGCIGSAPFTILEVGELDISILGNLLVCEDGFTMLMADPIDQGYDFVWSLNGVNTNELLVTAANVGTITLTATKGDCSGTAQVDLTLVPLPIANAGNTQELNCDNTTVTLDASDSSGSGITFIWSTADGNIVGPIDGPTIDANSSGTYTVQITESLNGCVNFDDVIVTQANDLPIAEAGLDGVLDCDNTSVTLDGDGSSEGANFTYLWTGDNSQTITNSTTLNPTVTEQGLYTLLVTDTNTGCTAVDIVNVTSDGSLPSGLLLDVMDPDCLGDENGSISILDVQGGEAPYMYSFNGGPFTDELDYTGLAAGTYILTVAGANGCEYSQTIVLQEGDDLTLELGPNQVIKFGDVAIIDVATNELEANIVDIQWTLDPPDPGFCYDCLGQEHSPSANTLYKLIITNDNGCIAQDNLFITILIEQNIFVPNIFTPNDNGVNDIFYIKTDGELDVKINYLKIYDRWGNLMFLNEDSLPNNPTEGWDGTFKGTTINPGVYGYVAEIIITSQSVEKTTILKGDITLVK